MAYTESDVRNALIADAPTLALVSTRIYPMRAPEAVATPYITYQLVANTPAVNLDSTSTDNRRLQLSIWAGTYAESKALAGVVRTALITLHGVPLLDLDRFDDETSLYGVILDYSFH